MNTRTKILTKGDKFLMEFRGIVIFPLESALKHYSSKGVQLEAWLHNALIRFIYRVETQLCNPVTFTLCNNLQLVDPLYPESQPVC